MVTIVLLNVDWMWACPIGMFFRSRFLARVARFRSAMDLLCAQLLTALTGPMWAGSGFGLLLATDADGAARSATLPGVRLGALSAHRQVAPMPDAAVGADIHQALDVLAHLAPQVSLDLVAAVDDLTQSVDLVFRQVS